MNGMFAGDNQMQFMAGVVKLKLVEFWIVEHVTLPKWYQFRKTICYFLHTEICSIGPLTLEEYTKQLQPMMQRCAEHEIKAMKEWKKDLEFWEWKPPTRWQKFKYRLDDLKQRAIDIWTIISGGEVHRNCGQ